MVTVYAVASGKGGVGKTTTAATLGAVLAEAGYEVVVVDADLGMPDLAELLDVDDPEPTLHDVLAGDVDVRDALHPGPAGLHVVPGGEDITAFAEGDPSGLRAVVEELDAFDYVILDTGAGLSHDSVLPLALADAVFLVSTPDRTALKDTARTRHVANRLGGRPVGVILTRVGPDGPDESLVSRVLDLPILGSIPEDSAVATALAAREPVTLYHPTSEAAEAYRRLASGVTGEDIPEPDAVAAADESAEADAADDLDLDEAGGADEVRAEDPHEGDAADETAGATGDDGEPKEDLPLDEPAGTEAAVGEADADEADASEAEGGIDVDEGDRETSEAAGEVGVGEAGGEVDAGATETDEAVDEGEAAVEVGDEPAEDLVLDEDDDADEPEADLPLDEGVALDDEPVGSDEAATSPETEAPEPAEDLELADPSDESDEDDSGEDDSEPLLRGGDGASDVEQATDVSEEAVDVSEEAVDVSEEATDASEEATDASEEATDVGAGGGAEVGAEPAAESDASDGADEPETDPDDEGEADAEPDDESDPSAGEESDLSVDEDEVLESDEDPLVESAEPDAGEVTIPGAEDDEGVYDTDLVGEAEPSDPGNGETKGDDGKKGFLRRLFGG